MKKMTIKLIRDFYENEVLTKKMLHEFINHPDDMELLKQYKRLTKYLFSLCVFFVIDFIIIKTNIYLYEPIAALLIILIMMQIIVREQGIIIKKAESLNGKTIEYNRSEKLILYCKNNLKLDFAGIQKLITECERKGNEKAVKISFIAFLGVIIGLAALFMGIIVAIQKDKILIYGLYTFLFMATACALWFFYNAVYVDYKNKESNSYRRITELLGEVNYTNRYYLHKRIIR